jgi:integrase
LAKPSKVKKVKHHAAMPIDAMPAFIKRLREAPGMSARALEYAILTAARSIEVRGALWSEIDLDAATWTVPASRMKAGKEHKVPLSPRAVELLEALPRFAGNDLVFPAPRGGMLSDMSLSAVLKRMKIEAVPHGFRSTFRDWAAERTNYPRDVAEMALAHAIGNKVEAAYRRGDLFAKRSHMMADWASFIGTLPPEGNVTNLSSRKRGAATAA